MITISLFPNYALAEDSFFIFSLSRFFHVFQCIFRTLCLLVVWSESHNFQFVHRQKTPFFTFLKQSFFYQIILEFSILSESMHILGSACFRIPQFLHWYMDICCWSGFDQILVTQYTLYNINYWWRFFWQLLTFSLPKMWRFSVSSKSENCGLLLMHSLKKVRFWSKYHWTESLKKVQNPDIWFYTVEERLWIWSRAA